MVRRALPESPRILIADDSDDIRTLFQLWLTFAGFRVHEACNGAEALILARLHRLDIVLMDLQMPVMDGVEAIRQLRADPVTAEVPIVVVTAQGTDDSGRRAQMAGANMYIEKPVQWEDLLRYVKAAFNRPRKIGEMIKVSVHDSRDQ